MEPEFYGNLIYKFKKPIRKECLDKLPYVTNAYDWYNVNVMRQSACLHVVFNPITVDKYASFFIGTPMDRASNSIMALILFGWGRMFMLLLGLPGFHWYFFFLLTQIFGDVWLSRDLQLPGSLL